MGYRSNIAIAMKIEDHQRLLTLARLRFANDTDNWLYKQVLNPKNIYDAKRVDEHGVHWTLILFKGLKWYPSDDINWFMDYVTGLEEFEYARQGESPDDFIHLGTREYFFWQQSEIYVIEKGFKFLGG